MMGRVPTFEELAARPDANLDVALGAALIARDVYATLDVTAHLETFNELAAPLSGERLGAASPETQAARLIEHVAVRLGFRGNEENYYDPRNSLLPDVLERRLGIPITLAIVLCEIARRAEVPARGVGFPGHFIVRIDGAKRMRTDGAVFIDPFAGTILDEAGLLRLLRRSQGSNAELGPEHLAAASPRSILVRMLTNLKSVYLARGDHARAHLALDRIVSLTPRSATALRERGSIAARLGVTEAARADLARVLELDPKAPDAAQLREQLAVLSAKPQVLN